MAISSWSLFDQRNLVEMSSPRFPGEGLVVCKNPALDQDRARKREELLQATERDLDKVVEAGRAGRLKGKDAIWAACGQDRGPSAWLAFWLCRAKFSLNSRDKPSWLGAKGSLAGGGPSRFQIRHPRK